jgi:hypothetical protein
MLAHPRHARRFSKDRLAFFQQDFKRWHGRPANFIAHSSAFLSMVIGIMIGVGYPHTLAFILPPYTAKLFQNR